MSALPPRLPTRFPKRGCRASLVSIALLGLSIAGGCNASPSYKFGVTLHNASDQPVTVCLTKTAGPDEKGWEAPEDMAGLQGASLNDINAVVVPSGKTADVGPLAGKFYNDSLAMLRVYAGELSLDQMLATKADGKLRVDVPLNEGWNHLTVNSKAPLRVDRDPAKTTTVR